MSALEMKAFLARTEEEVETKMKIKDLGFGFGFGFGAESSTICRVGVLLLYTEFHKKDEAVRRPVPVAFCFSELGLATLLFLLGDDLNYLVRLKTACVRYV